MKNGFSQNLLLLRKERGLSQKQVAGDLHISQALLSHYEKGIRECGLEFVLKVSDYFGVSCDFLLGKTTQKSLKATESGKAPADKVLQDTIHIVFGFLKKINSKALTKEAVNYLYCAVYTILRIITRGGEDLYGLDNELYSAVASSKMTMCKAKARTVIKTEGLEEQLPELCGGGNQAALHTLRELIKKSEL